MTIIYSKQAVKTLGHLDAPTKARIRNAINNLPNGDIKKLKSYATSFRLRVGDWRIIFKMTAQEINVDAILPRGEAYKK